MAARSNRQGATSSSSRRASTWTGTRIQSGLWRTIARCSSATDVQAASGGGVWTKLTVFGCSRRSDPASSSARTGGQWIDLLRRPGGSDPQLAESLARLNALSRIGRSGEGSDPPLAAKPQTAAHRNDEHRPQADANSQPRRMASQLSSLLRPFRGSVLLLLALSAAAVGVEVVPPLLQGMLVDRVLTTDAAHRPSAQLLLLLLAIVIGSAVGAPGGHVVGVWKGCVSSRVGTTLTADLRNELVAKLNALALGLLTTATRWACS